MTLDDGSEDDSMETNVTDKQACFVLFQKFVREVSIILFYTVKLFSMPCYLNCNYIVIIKPISYDLAFLVLYIHVHACTCMYMYM